MSFATEPTPRTHQTDTFGYNPAETPASSHPKMRKATVRRFVKCSPETPYSVPTKGSEGVARAKHRTYYWLVNDYWSYECPDCGRSHERVYEFDVHHIDRDPNNGDPENLIALCRRCHAWRHDGQSISGLDVHEWKTEFVGVSQE